MNINSPLVTELRDKTYRDAYVQSQIRTMLPFQLRSLRTSKGFSQEYVAERAGMAQPRISDLERPTGRMPNLETLCRIVSALDVALEVRFVPFSELIRNSEGFDPDNFSVKTFEEEIQKATEMQKGMIAAKKKQLRENELAFILGAMASRTRGHITVGDPVRSRLRHFPTTSIRTPLENAHE